ncbi:MAG: hypothetical protein IPL61_20515 [Myxococcales bacterium]|nr:hypothetical protein [Myxococcales bacterium]
MRAVRLSVALALTLFAAACGGDDAPAAVDAPVAVDAAIDAEIDAPVCAGMVCDSVCVDTATDEDHCGDCTTVCAATQVCLGSVCGCPTIDVPPAPSLLQSGTRVMGASTIGFGGILGNTIDALIAGYPTDTVQLNTPYTLTGAPTPPFVGYGYELDLTTQTPKLAYFASAGVVTFTKICPAGFSGTLTNATFNQVMGLMNPAPVVGGCAFQVASLTFEFGDVSCP